MSKIPIARTKDSTGRHICQIGFFSPDASVTRDGAGQCVNNVVGWWTAKEGIQLSHVEFRFSNGLVTSVTADGPVHLEQRVLSGKGYTRFFQLYLTPQQEKKIYLLAKKYHQEKIQFDNAGMWIPFIPLFGSCIRAVRTPKGVFCSQYILTLLQEGGMLLDKDPGSTSPTDLYMMIKRELPNAMASVNFAKPKRPVKMQM